MIAFILFLILLLIVFINRNFVSASNSLDEKMDRLIQAIKEIES